jgi:hypothetical protein
MSKYSPTVPTLYALNQIEDRIQDLIELIRTLYPTFNSDRHQEGVMMGLLQARGALSYLQDQEEQE